MSFEEMRIMTPPTQGFVFARLGDDMVEHLWKMIRRAENEKEEYLKYNYYRYYSSRKLHTSGCR